MSAQSCGCGQEAHRMCAQHRDVFDDVIAERDALREQLARAQHAEAWWKDQYFIVEQKWHAAEQQVATLTQERADIVKRPDSLRRAT